MKTPLDDAGVGVGRIAQAEGGGEAEEDDTGRRSMRLTYQPSRVERSRSPVEVPRPNMAAKIRSASSVTLNVMSG